MKGVARPHPDNCSQPVSSVKAEKSKLEEKNARCVLVEREPWTSKRSNLTCFTVMTRVFESLLQLQLYKSRRVQVRDTVAVTGVTVPGAIGRPTDDTVFGGTE
jgi:hypothetical protein